MSNRTDDLALQARNRAEAERRAQGGSVQGNSDAAERPRALEAEQQRKANERSGASVDERALADLQLGGGNDGRGGVDSTVVTDRTAPQDAQRTPSPGQAPVSTAPDQLTRDLANVRDQDDGSAPSPQPFKGASQADLVEAGNKAAKK